MENVLDVFEFLKISRREDVLHTPMIAGLLDRFGAHGLGSLFLGKFLELLSSPGLPLGCSDAEDYNWVVGERNWGQIFTFHIWGEKLGSDLHFPHLCFADVNLFGGCGLCETRIA
jgi:hypothetical protein